MTVKLRKGVMFSDPVDREVTSADVKYAIERAFTAAVSNGYVQTYFGDLVGAPKAPGDYRPVSGIQTPDKHTIVFKLNAGHRRRAGGRARDADLGPGAEGVRAPLRPRAAVDLRRAARRLHRALHGRRATRRAT